MFPFVLGMGKILYQSTRYNDLNKIEFCISLIYQSGLSYQSSCCLLSPGRISCVWLLPHPLGLCSHPRTEGGTLAHLHFSLPKRKRGRAQRKQLFFKLQRTALSTLVRVPLPRTYPCGLPNQLQRKPGNSVSSRPLHKQE